MRQFLSSITIICSLLEETRALCSALGMNKKRLITDDLEPGESVKWREHDLKPEDDLSAHRPVDGAMTLPSGRKVSTGGIASTQYTLARDCPILSLYRFNKDEGSSITTSSLLPVTDHSLASPTRLHRGRRARGKRLDEETREHAARVRQVGACDECRARKVKVC